MTKCHDAAREGQGALPVRCEQVGKGGKATSEKDVRQGKVAWEGSSGDLKVAAALFSSAGFGGKNGMLPKKLRSL